MYYTYILQSRKDQSLYIGFSADLKSRYKQHNEGKVISTKSHIPYDLIYYEAYIDKKDETGRETFHKSGSGRRFIKKQLKHYLEKHPLREVKKLRKISK